MSDEPGMIVDGDVLRDVIADAVPSILTDDEATAIAERALDGAVRAGMTVLHGQDGTPREAICGQQNYPGPDGSVK